MNATDRQTSPRARPTARMSSSATARAQARHRAYYLSLVEKNPEDWERIDPLYGQIKRALHVAPDDESLLEFVRALATYQERRGLWEDRISLV
ncbi:MAG: hypothetical protein KDD83_30425, partial [Caldilineaceae bacterium]|nr:hypothetical protein [Caldilineaceae bacterium]